MKGVYKSGLKNGEFIFYHPNGKVESVGDFVSNERAGIWKYFYANGNPKQEIEFSNGAKKILYYNDSLGQQLLKDGNGFWKEEYEEPWVSQLVINEGHLKNYEKDGQWICRFQNGTILFKETYSKGKFEIGTNYNRAGEKLDKYYFPAQNTLLVHYKFAITEKLTLAQGVKANDYPFLRKLFIPAVTVPSTAEQVIHNGNLNIDSTKEVFTPVEVSAHPIGGMQAFYRAIGQAIRYPKEARTHRIQGRVYVEFVIEKDGSLSNFRVVNGIGSGCDEEAIRVIKESNETVKWEPGKQKGVPVKQRYTLPIIFRMG
ncbi:MAG: TonB family protein [Bacteroidota bacterium]